MRFRVVTLVMLMVHILVFGQTVEPSLGVAKGMLQFEFESIYLSEKEEAEEVSSWSIPSLLLRYGLGNSLEFQFNMPFIREAVYQDNSFMSSRTFLDKVQIGLSANLWKENGLLPEAALMLRALVPVYEYDTSNIGRLVALNMSNSLSDALSLNYNVGWVSEEGENSGYYIVNLSWNISSKIHSFVEFFGSTIRDIEMTHNINTGIGFNLGKSFCLDVSVGNGLNQDTFFAGGILTYQLNLRSNQI